MSTACCPPAPPSTLDRTSATRWLAPLHRVWIAWRAQSLRRAEFQALQQLSDRTRRDIGLAERAPPAPGGTLWDYERGLW